MHVFTARSIDQVMNKLGGTAYWKVDANRIKPGMLVMLYRNADAKMRREVGETKASEEHGRAFAVGEVRDVVKAHHLSRWPDRSLIRFTRLSLLKSDNPPMWPKNRNPVLYGEVEIDPAQIEWRDIDPNLPLPDEMLDPTHLTIDEAKRRLALTMGVEPSAISITVNA